MGLLSPFHMVKKCFYMDLLSPLHMIGLYGDILSSITTYYIGKL